MDPHEARARLENERNDILAMSRDLVASFEDIVDGVRDSNLDDEHDPEGNTIAVERSLVSSLAESAAIRLAQIEAALARVEDGSYGRCLRCGAAISEGRLSARPTAETCMSCAGQPREDGR